MDDDTKAILITQAAALEHLAAGQVAIAQGLHAVAAVIEQQQLEGAGTSKQLAILNAGIKAAQERTERHRKASEDAAEEVRKRAASLVGR